jgi:hypothetical protein
MFASIKNTMQNKKAVRLLLAIAAATLQSPTGCVYLNEKDLALVNAEPSFIMVNPTLKNAAGEVAVRATDAGVAAAQSAGAQAAAAPAQAPAEKQEFVIESGIAIPPTQRGGARGDVYPFGKLEAGQSFVVPATDAKPNPAKSLASTVSAATRRFKVGENFTRKFTIRAIKAGENGEKVTGARVFRTV